MPHTGPAFAEMERLIPLFKSLEPKSLLYVGMRHDCAPWWQKVFSSRIGASKLAVLEIDIGNCNEFRKRKKDYDCDVYHGDVREIGQHVTPGQYDVIFWDHGPEHVSWEDLQKTTPNLIEYAGKILVYCCPLGVWPQGPEGGNVHEEHKNYVTTEQFTQLGLEIITTGKPGQENLGEIIGYKVKS